MRIIQRFVYVSLIVAGLTFPGQTPSSKPPRFEDFKAAPEFTGSPAKPLLRTPGERMFATQIRTQARMPANFAARYRIASWGCGTSCISIAVVDLKTGFVYNGPFGILGYGTPYQYEGGSDQPLEYHASSNLMIARGCPDDKNCGTYYFLWKNNHFSRLRFSPHGPLSN